VKRHLNRYNHEDVRIPLGSHLKVNRLEKERKGNKEKKNSNKFTVHVYEKKIKKNNKC
jgi:hypothetical protein